MGTYRRTFLFLLFFLAASVPPVQGAALLRHNIMATVDPPGHRISARDRIQGLDAGKVELELASALGVLSVMAGKTDMDFERHGDRLMFELPDPPPEAVEIHYEGETYLLPGESEAVRAGGGAGYPLHISTDEVFLHAEGKWYPAASQTGPGFFTLNLAMKGGLISLSQGNLENRSTSSGAEETRWSTPSPVNGLSVLAGPYKSFKRDVDGLTYSVYTREYDEKNSALLVEASEKYMTFYTSLLGPYPYQAWSMVESSFFMYHFPGVALLDPRVAHQASRLIQPGYLDHYLVHAWLGSHVVPELHEGNWSEPLVTYITSHYYRESKGNPNEARNLRIQTVERFSMLVLPDEEYPLRDYTEPRETFASEVAYGKGAMFFHLLRKQIGEDAFAKALGELVRGHGGKTTTWSDIERVFQAVTTDDLEVIFAQWLRRTGGPRLRLDSPAYARRNGVFVVTGTIIQEGAPYALEIPVRVEGAYGPVTQLIPVRDLNTPFEIELSAKPESMVLDPDYHIFRVLATRDIHPSLARLLQDPSHAYVKGPDARSSPVESLIRNLREKKGGWVIDEAHLSDSLGLGGVFILGKPPLLGVRGIGKPELEFYTTGFTFLGHNYSDPGEAILYSFDNPFLPGSTISVFAGNTPEALAYAQYVPYYGNDTYTVFVSGVAVERGYLPFSPPSTSFRFPDNKDKE